jgi:NADP-dependent 3-hydroxy acid dehydrogenase YdfG
MFRGQVAAITGASSGIGKTIMRSLAAHGAIIAALGRNQHALEMATADIDPQRVHLITIDLASDNDLDRFVADWRTRIGQVDMLILSAGMYHAGPVLNTPVEILDTLFKVNIRAPYILIRALLPNLIERHGQIVFINSSAVAAARANISQYVATKAALKAIADGLRDEVNSAGVRVMSVYPGRTASPMQAAIFEADRQSYTPERLLQTEDIAAAVLTALSLPRTAEITDLYIRPFNKSNK